MRLVHGSSVNTGVAEMNYKCITRWYRTLDIVGKYQMGQTMECWRGCKQTGTMAHIWWSCPKIRTYWKEILRYIMEITSYRFAKGSMDMSISWSRYPNKRIQKLND